MISLKDVRRTVVPAFFLFAVAIATPVSAEPDMEKFNKSCGICHTAGVAGAPKVNDADAWAPRMEKGMDVLLSSVKNGLNAMPPMGMCADCTDEEFKELITYMSSPK